MPDVILFFETILFLYSSFFVGKFILNRLAASFSYLQTIVLGILLGMGVWGIIGFLLGLAGLFSALILRTLLVLIFIAFGREIYAHFKTLFSMSLWRKVRALFKGNGVFKGLIIVWLLLTFLIVFMPITGYDTIKYHLPIIEDITESEKLTFSSDIYNYAFLPVFAEIIYAVPLAIFNNVTDPYIFQLIQYSVFFLFLLLVYDFAKDKVGHNFLPFVLVLATLSMMDLQREVLHGGYIDVVMFVFALASVLILLKDIEKGNLVRGNLIISALLLGFAVSMKYLALFFLGFNGLVLIYCYLYRKISRESFIRFLRAFLLYLFIVFLIAGFWYVRNVITYGDPVYPMIRGGEFLEEFDFGWWVTGDRNIVNMFLFPFLKYSEVFFDRANESSSILVMLGYFVALYILTLFLYIVRKKFTFTEVALFFLIHFYLWLLFFISHQERYLLGGIMLLPLLLVLLGDRLLLYWREASSGDFNRKLLKIITVILIAGFLFTFAGSIHYFQYKYRYLISIDTREEYILNIGGQ